MILQLTYTKDRGLIDYKTITLEDMPERSRRILCYNGMTFFDGVAYVDTDCVSKLYRSNYIYEDVLKCMGQLKRRETIQKILG
jgi:hypothetical protein